MNVLNPPLMRSPMESLPGTLPLACSLLASLLASADYNVQLADEDESWGSESCATYLALDGLADVLSGVVDGVADLAEDTLVGSVTFGSRHFDWVGGW